MVKNKKHYYDGKIYNIFSDNVLKEVRQIILQNIKSKSTVIDIGCGTGELVLSLAKKCKKVVGIDLSLKMIKYAKKNTKDNIKFFHQDATNLKDVKNKQYDYAVISMALHEMLPQSLRLKVLIETKRIAKKIIIADYATPLPFNFKSLGIYIVEFIAGINHFKGFRNFQKNNGINQIIKNTNLRIDKDFKTKDKTIRVVILK